MPPVSMPPKTKNPDRAGSGLGTMVCCPRAGGDGDPGSKTGLMYRPRVGGVGRASAAARTIAAMMMMIRVSLSRWAEGRSMSTSTSGLLLSLLVLIMIVGNVTRFEEDPQYPRDTEFHANPNSAEALVFGSVCEQKVLLHRAMRLEKNCTYSSTHMREWAQRKRLGYLDN